MKKSQNSALALDRATVATLTPALPMTQAPVTGTQSWSFTNCCD